MPNIIKVFLWWFLLDLIVVEIIKPIVNRIIYKIKQHKEIKKLAEEILKPQSKGENNTNENSESNTIISE